MRSQMFGQIVCAGKTFTTHITMIRPFPRMNPQMPRQIALATESPPAKKAHERPLPRVLPHVQLQILLGAHALTAKGTREPSLPLSLDRISAQEADDGSLLGVPKRLGRAASRGAQRKSHRVDGIVLFRFGLLGVRRDHLYGGQLVAGVFLLYVDGVHHGFVFVDGDRLVRARHLVVAAFDERDVRVRCFWFGSVRVLPMESLQGVIQSVFLKGFEVPELHAADVAGEQLVRRETRPVVLLPVLDVRRAVSVALATLFADERFVDRAQGADVLQGGVLLQQPN